MPWRGKLFVQHVALYRSVKYYMLESLFSNRMGMVDFVPPLLKSIERDFKIASERSISWWRHRKTAESQTLTTIYQMFVGINFSLERMVDRQ